MREEASLTIVILILVVAAVLVMIVYYTAFNAKIDIGGWLGLLLRGIIAVGKPPV